MDPKTIQMIKGLITSMISSLDIIEQNSTLAPVVADEASDIRDAGKMISTLVKADKTIDWKAL